MQTEKQIPPKPDRKLSPGLAWQYDQTVNDWVIANTPVTPGMIQSANEYFSLDLSNLKKAPALTVINMPKETCNRVKHLFALSNLSTEPVSEQILADNHVKLGLPLYKDDMLILIENEQ